MRRDLDALLALQTDDTAVDALEARLRAIGPRAVALDRAREAAADRVARASAAIEQDERRRHELEERIAEHRQRHQRNLSYLDTVKKMRDATAAMAQVEQARKVLIEEESELHAIARRIAEARTEADSHRQALAGLEASQDDERRALAAERDDIERQLGEARAKRAGSAATVPRALLGKYERIRGRHGAAGAVFKLRNNSCGNCDTALPIQRRSSMVARGDIEVCEACGVLLYADAAAPV